MNQITTCYDTENLFASRWEFSWLTERTPKEHLEALIGVSDVINAWMKAQSLSHPPDCPLYVYPWYWLPLITEEDAYGAKLSFGANPRDEVMEHMRRKRPIVYQYPSMLYIVVKVPPIPGAIEPARRGVGTSTASEMGYPALGYREWGENFESGLLGALNEMADEGYRVFRELKRELNHVEDQGTFKDGEGI